MVGLLGDLDAVGGQAGGLLKSAQFGQRPGQVVANRHRRQADLPKELKAMLVAQGGEITSVDRRRRLILGSEVVDRSEYPGGRDLQPEVPEVLSDGQGAL